MILKITKKLDTSPQIHANQEIHIININANY